MRGLITEINRLKHDHLTCYFLKFKFKKPNWDFQLHSFAFDTDRSEILPQCVDWSQRLMIT